MIMKGLGNLAVLAGILLIAVEINRLKAFDSFYP